MVSNLDQNVNEDLIWELFIQAGIVNQVYFPWDKITGEHQGYCFVEMQSILDC